MRRRRWWLGAGSFGSPPRGHHRRSQTPTMEFLRRISRGFGPREEEERGERKEATTMPSFCSLGLTTVLSLSC